MASITEVLTLAEAGKRYAGTALTKTAIRRLVVTGEIPSRRIGVKYLIPAEAIEKWLQGEQATPENRRSIYKIGIRG